MNSTEWKQSICNQILGASHRDVEKAMQGIIKERKTVEPVEKVEQEKFEMPEPTRPIRTTLPYTTYSKEEVAKLLGDYTSYRNDKE